MKSLIHTSLIACAALMHLPAAQAADIDLFQAGTVAGGVPNVLFTIDNSANWQATIGGVTKQKMVHDALHTVVTNPSHTDRFRAGIQVFSHGNSPKGGKVYSAIQDMSAANQVVLGARIKGPLGEMLIPKANNAPYALMMREAYAYFAGQTPLAGVQDGNHDPAAIGLNGKYLSPGGSCRRNYIVLIGNGSPDSGENNAAEAELSALGGLLPGDPINLNPKNFESNWSDEFARYMSDTEVVPSTVQTGNQNVTTYVIDVYDPNSAQAGSKKFEAARTWMKSIARNGEGRYFAAQSALDITMAIEQIISELSAVSSVFAATALPVSVNVRGTNLNQVYMGVFRPDKHDRPRWPGNLKLYQLAVDTSSGNLYLADARGNPAQSAVTGFIVPDAESYWTQASSYWSFDPSGTPPSVSDLPDGEVIEKGGAAQQLRELEQPLVPFASLRKLYTCSGSCTAGAALKGTPFDAINVTSLLTGTLSALDNLSLVNWMLGNDIFDADADGSVTDVRPDVHGDVLHSDPVIVNYSDSNVIGFYGANDGTIRALQGGKAATDGVELWGFVPPEFLPRLKDIRDNVGTGKSYFADGGIGVYKLDANNDGDLLDHASGDRVWLFVTMRRGGDMIYALDVSDPLNPVHLWSHRGTDPGWQELGQSWSKPKVVSIRASADPHLVFGAGYDTVNDLGSGAGAVRGRGVMVVNARTGGILWQAGPKLSGPASGGIYHTRSEMTFAIPSDVSVLDRNGDGHHDRVYVGDTGGNLWRLDIHDLDPNNWQVHWFASVGSSYKFLYPPDVVYREDANGPYDAVLIGTGNRERPLDTSVINRYYMFKDRHVSLTAPVGMLPINEGMLFDATSNSIQNGDIVAAASLTAASGWFIRLENAGEKVVSASVTLNGTTFFNTMQPPPPSGSTVCANALGIARNYMVQVDNATATADNDGIAGLTSSDRFGITPGGGFPPSPVPVIVELGGRTYQAVISGATVHEPPGLQLGARRRTFWFRNLD